jgi:hypothetical protein
MMSGLEFKEAFEKEKYEFKQLHPLERYAFILLILFTLPGLFGMFGVAIGIFATPSAGESIAQNEIPSAIIAKFISICLLLFIRDFFNYSFVRKFVWFTIFWIVLHYCIGLPSLLGSDDGISSLELWSKQNLRLIGLFSMVGCILFGVPLLYKKR